MRKLRHRRGDLLSWWVVGPGVKLSMSGSLTHLLSIRLWSISFTVSNIVSPVNLFEWACTARPLPGLRARGSGRWHFPPVGLVPTVACSGIFVPGLSTQQGEVSLCLGSEGEVHAEPARERTSCSRYSSSVPSPEQGALTPGCLWSLRQPAKWVTKEGQEQRQATGCSRFMWSPEFRARPVSRPTSH